MCELSADHGGHHRARGTLVVVTAHEPLTFNSRNILQVANRTGQAINPGHHQLITRSQELDDGG